MSDLKPISQFDFSGGENTSVSPFLLPKNQCQQIVNMVLTEHGSLKTRDGTLIQTPTNTVRNNRAISAIVFSIYYPTGGSFIASKTLAVTSDNVLWLIGTPWTSMGNLAQFVNTISPGSIVNFQNLTIFTSGAVAAINAFDPNTNALTPLTDTGTASNLVPQYCFLMSTYSGALLALYTDLINKTYTAHGASLPVGPDSVQSSDVNNPNSWPTAFQFYLDKGNGDQITGAALFTLAETGITPNQITVLFKNYSTYQLTGQFGSSPSNIVVQKVKTDMGCIAPSTIQFVSGLGIIRLTHKGFALFDGLNDTIISEQIRPRLFGGNGFPGLNWAGTFTSIASETVNPLTYVCVTSDLNGTQWMFMYDIVRNSWTVHQFAHIINSLASFEFPHAEPVLYAGDYVSGGGVFPQIRRLFSGDATDDGTAVLWSATLRPTFGSTPVNRSYFRRSLVDINVTGTPAPITMQTFYGNTSKTTAKTPATRSQDSVIDFPLGFIANNSYPQISGSGQVTIRGVETHLRAKPATRSVVAAGDA